MKRFFRIFLSGLLALAPLLITGVAAVWLVQYANAFFGPGSTIGAVLISVGLSVDSNSVVPYFAGLLVVVLLVCLIGLLVETRIGPWFASLLESVVLRIPVVSSVYSLAKRLVSIVDLSDNEDLKSMSPVWCFFGGDEDGAAVLALLPTTDAVNIGTSNYLGVLVPTAPVPIGGALIYVPATWVKPVDGGVDHLMSVYVSMGVTPPHGTKIVPLAPEASAQLRRPPVD